MLVRVAFLVALVVGAIACTSTTATSQAPTPTVVATPTVRYTPIPTEAPIVDPNATPTPVKYTITGVVTDASGKPLFNQIVGAYTGDYKFCPSFTAIGEKPPLASGFFTRSDGSYRLMVTPGVYILKAGTVFWKNKTDCRQADLVTVSGDMVIDIVLQ